MSHLMHLACIALIAIGLIAVVADCDLQPAIVGLSRLDFLAVAAMNLAGRALAVHFFSPLLQGSYRNSDYHPPNLIDLNCTRLC
jgi:hypothetical protein